MTTPFKSLFAKEWIKLRKAIWILPLLLLYASVDGFLILRTIERKHGAFGLWATLMEKEPIFFKGYLLLALGGAILGFLQAWPECQGKRLRLFFHLPVQPARSVAVMVSTGLTWMFALNLLAFALLAGTLKLFHLPGDVVRPISIFPSI